MKSKHPEIILIDSFLKQNSIRFSECQYVEHELFFLKVSFDTKSMYILIDDEYSDLKLNNKLINCVLMLRSLELIEESNDYLHWLKLISFNHSDILRTYYQDIIKEMSFIKSLFESKEVTSFVSGLDFELNSGAMQYLRTTS